MIGIDDIVPLLNTTRKDFAGVFSSAQISVGGLKNTCDFEGITQQPNDLLAFREALEFSRKSRPSFYEEMVRMIIVNGLDNGEIVRKQGLIGDDEFKGLTNFIKGFMQPSQMIQGMIRGQNLTGQVVIDNEPKGSGVLIGPKRFLTAWHVVRNMFEPSATNPAEYIPKTNPPQLEVIFDYYIDFTNNARRRAKTTRLRAEKDWNEAFCHCHQDELADMLPTPTTALSGFWDYAIIRLEDGLDNERRWIDLEQWAEVPNDNANIIIFQYPNGSFLRFDIDIVVSPAPPDNAIPGIRFLHHTNTDHGSSGGPVFDKSFSLVGIHQGHWPNNVNMKTTKKGIPIKNIIQDIEFRYNKTNSSANILLGSTPEDYLIWFLDRKDYDPVIGIDDIQFRVLNNIRLRKNNTVMKGSIISVQGEKGSGKTFRLQSVFALLNDTEHLKIPLAAEMISKMDCIALVEYIYSKITPDKPDIQSLENYNSTAAAWLKDEVVQKLITTLESRRNGRMVWISISNLNIFDINGKYLSEFLLLLYECTLQNSWLHIILDGPKTDLPVTLAEPAQVYEVKRKTREDISRYLARLFRETGIMLAGEVVSGFTDILYNQYSNQLGKEPSQAMALLRDQLKLLVLNLMTLIHE